MKKSILAATFCVALFSCNNDENNSKTSLSTQKNDILNFQSYEKMDAKIDDISETKAQMEKSTSAKYVLKSSNNLKNNSEDEILESLKNYNNDRLKDIYELRKITKFTSIQSIADEINSLTIIDSIKSDKLFKEYEKYLIKDKYEIKTIFESRTANVINTKGEVLINGNILNLKANSNSLTGRYVEDESVRTAQIATFSNGIIIEYSAGREKHKDDFGKTFFRYFTEFKSYINSRGGFAPYPATFDVEQTSIAGFSQSGNMPFSDFAFSMQYPSGSGSSIRNTGDQKWTAYQPEGGNIKGTFSVTIQSRYASSTETVKCDFKYNR